MAKIIRMARPAYKGMEVWTEEDPTPVYLSPSTEKGLVDKDKLTPAGMAFIDAVLAQRVTDRLASEKQGAVDAALAAEVEKRKAAVPDLYAKTPTDAVTAVFGTVSGGTK